MNAARRQRIVRTVVVVAIAIGAGHIAQSNVQPKVRFASLIPDVTPVAVVTPAETGDATPQRNEPVPDGADRPLLPDPDTRPAADDRSRSVPPLPVAPRAELDCARQLSLSAAPGGIIDVTLQAPCDPDVRVVLRHAGLAVTYRTSALGTLSARLPGLEADAEVSVLFTGGETADAALALPEIAGFRRFGVQWQGPKAFDVNAFEGGADYGTPGHVSAANPHMPGEKPLSSGGFMTVVGDDGVDLPMLAEIYTFPAGSVDVPVVIEAAITPATCGREILGETLTVMQGTVRLADLSVTMPGCDAVGDYLVLKNLVPDLKLAAAN